MSCTCREYAFAECQEDQETAAMLDENGDLLVFAHPPDFDRVSVLGAVPMAVIDALRAERMLHASGNACANCGLSAALAEHCLAGGDDEWFCSEWCEQDHDWRGCPFEQIDGAAEQKRRAARRIEAQRSREVAQP